MTEYITKLTTLDLVPDGVSKIQKTTRLMKSTLLKRLILRRNKIAYRSPPPVISRLKELQHPNIVN